MYAGPLNIEYVLLFRDDEIAMALKRDSLAPAEGEEAAMHIVIFGNEAEPQHRLEAVCFVLPTDQRGVNFGDFTPFGIESKRVISACRNARWWHEWETPFRQTFADDGTP